jgi:hypothetical protein
VELPLVYDLFNDTDEAWHFMRNQPRNRHRFFIAAFDPSTQIVNMTDEIV